jgi:phosphatidate cytidylyltransferase
VPLDKQVFRTRALSAIVFGIIMLTALVFGDLILFSVFGIITFIAAKEYYHIQSLISKTKQDDTVATIYALALVVFYAFVANSGPKVFFQLISITLNNYIIITLVVTAFWLLMLKGKAPAARLFTGYFYIPLSFGLFVQLFQYNAKLPLMLMLLIWVNDTMQYIVGSYFGKTKMAPIISPKKTWEGTLGGSALAVLVGLAIGASTHWFSWQQSLAIGLIAAIMGTLGDLLESKIKRIAQIKDSGSLMPGHGGALDRFDSLLLAGASLWLAWQLGLAMAN